MFSVGAMAQTVVGETNSNTIVQGASSTTVTAQYVDIKGTSQVTITAPNTQINGSQKVSGNLEVQGHTKLTGPSATIGGGSSVTTLSGHNTLVNSNYTNLNSAQTFINGEKTEFRQGIGSSKTLTTISQTGISTAGSVTGAQIFTQGMEVGNEIINLKNSVNSKASAASVTNLTNTVENNRVNAASATAGVQSNLDAYKLSNDAAVSSKADKSEITRLDGRIDETNQAVFNLDARVTTEVTRLDGRIDATNTTVSNLTTTVETNRVEAAKATAQVQTNLNTQVNRLDKDIASLEDRKADKKQVTADIATAKSEAISIANTYTDKAEKRLTDRVDAVGRQLDDLRVDLGNETTRAMTAEMNITNEMRGLGAMTAAMVSAQGSQLYSPTKRGNVSIGTGYYRGATAVSAGVSYFTSSNTKINTNIATGTHIKLAVGIGASFGF